VIKVANAVRIWPPCCPPQE